MAGSLGDLFVTVGAKIDGFKNAMKEVSHGMDETAEHAKHTAESISKSFGGLGAGMLEMLGATGLIIGITEIGETFEKAAHKIQQTTGATGHELHGLEETFKDIYITSAASAENIVAAMTTIERKTGATGESLESLTKSALKFAKVTGTDIATSVQQNQKVFAAWGIEVEQQSAALDVMYVATQKTGIGADVLSAALLEMGPVLRNVGFNFTESTALIASFEKAGLNAADMTMGLNKVFVAFAQAGKDPKAALFDLIEKMSEAETRAQALNMAMDAGFNGKTAGRFVDAVKSGALSLKDLQAALEKSGGAVNDMAAKTQTLSGAWTKLGHAMSALLEKPGKEVVGFLGEVTQKMADLVTEITKGTFRFVDFARAARAAIGGGVAGAAGAFGESVAGRLADREAHGAGAHKVSPADLGTPEGGGAGVAEASTLTDKVHAYKELSDGLAVIVARYHEAQSAHSAMISEIAKSGFDIEGFFLNSLNRASKALMDFGETTDKLAVSMFDAIYPPKKLAETMDELSESIIKSAQAALDLSPYKALEEGLKALGITSAHEYQVMADKASEAYAKIMDSGLATTEEQTRAWIMMEQAQLEASRAAGGMILEEYERRKRALKGMMDELDKASGKTVHQTVQHISLIGRQLESVFKSIGSSIASVVLGEKSIGDAMKDVGKQIVKIIVEDVVQYAFGRLFTAISKGSGMLGALGSALSGVFGGGSSAAGGAASSAGGAASSGASGAAGAVGAASSMLSIVGVVAQVGTMISSIVSNFQLHAVNKSLDLIEKSTRYTEIYTGEQPDSILNTSHRMAETLRLMAVDMKGIVGINLTGAITSDKANGLLDGLLNSSQNLYVVAAQTLIEIRDSVRGGTTLLLGQLHEIAKGANPSILQRLLNGSGLLGGVGAIGGGIGSAVGGIGSAIGGFGSLISGAVSKLFGSGNAGAFDAIVKHTLQTANDLANLRVDEWSRHSQTFMRMGEIWNSIRDINTTLLAGSAGGYAAAGAGGGGGVIIDLRGATFNSGATQADADRIGQAIALQLHLAGAV